ncbi:unnamed protein product [Acanthoscelides obtectus]|uniref:Uncharacterized protein n=1 Tax=Acanthoscelides obtectus TaxID=200917 RepID=A0A9P0LVT1_ACAOB|nr:unnamed protein product [Acanthoscelides obtectus]CAK1623179.1 hypothetical protein AOBTE_LOCUS1862 [Acanthoscelides obtectus]
MDFGEEHPTIFGPQFKHGDGDARQNAICWENLVQSLNSMEFGLRSLEKWKTVWFLNHDRIYLSISLLLHKL